MSADRKVMSYQIWDNLLIRIKFIYKTLWIISLNLKHGNITYLLALSDCTLLCQMEIWCHSARPMHHHCGQNISKSKEEELEMGSECEEHAHPLLFNTLSQSSGVSAPHELFYWTTIGPWQYKNKEHLPHMMALPIVICTGGLGKRVVPRLRESHHLTPSDRRAWVHAT